MSLPEQKKPPLPPLKICVLLPDATDSESPVAQVDIPCTPAPFLAGHALSFHLLRKDSAVRQLEALSRQGFDLFFNLYDGLPAEGLPGVAVVQALERLGLPFTGARSDFFDQPRQQVKAACRALNLPTPAYAFVASLAQAQAGAGFLRFPLIVKHPNSFCSIALTPHSRVETCAELLAQVAHLLQAYGGALVEEFIEGREFTVLVAENPADAAAPLVYRPHEVRFPAGETFKHFRLKWVDYAGLHSVPLADPAPDAQLRQLTRRVFVGMGGSGYARCDFRMNAAGELFLLDVNANCGLYYPPEAPGSADLILLHSPGGHQAFTDQLLRCALQRAAKRF